MNDVKNEIINLIIAGLCFAMSVTWLITIVTSIPYNGRITMEFSTTGVLWLGFFLIVIITIFSFLWFLRKIFYKWKSDVNI